MSSRFSPGSRWSPRKVFRYALIGVAVLIVLVLVGARWNLRRQIHAEIARLRAATQPVTLEELAKRYADLGGRRDASAELAAAITDLLSTWDRLFTNTFDSQLRAEDLPLMGKGPNIAATESIPSEFTNAVALAMIAMTPAFDQLGAVMADTNAGFRNAITITNGFNMLLPHLSRLRQVARWLVLRNAWQLEQGDDEAAVQTTVNLFRLSRSIEAEPIVISQLLRMAVVKVALSSVERMATQRQLSKDQVRQLRQELALARPDQAMHLAMMGERCTGLDFMYFRPGNLDGLGAADPHPSTVSAASVLMLLYRMTGLADRDTLFYLNTMDACVTTGTNSVSARLDLAASNAFDPRSQGKFAILSGMLLPALGKAFQKEADCLTSVAAAEAMLAVEAYRIDHHGQIPVNLAELVPVYTETAPIDPATDKQLTITPTKNGYTIDGNGPLFNVSR